MNKSSYGLENESYETIQWCERNYDYLVYIGMLQIIRIDYKYRSLNILMNIIKT